MCLEPRGPQLVGLYHSATVNTVTVNANNVVVSPFSRELDAFVFSHTTPLGGASTAGYVSRYGGSITITNLSSGTRLSAVFYGVLNRTSCGEVIVGSTVDIGVWVHGLCTGNQYVNRVLTSTLRYMAQGDTFRRRVSSLSK